jgi:hypothetical protein
MSNIGVAYVGENFCLNNRFCGAMTSHWLLRRNRPRRLRFVGQRGFAGIAVGL